MKYVDTNEYMFFDLYDLDSDGIPELFLSRGMGHMCQVDILTVGSKGTVIVLAENLGAYGYVPMKGRYIASWEWMEKSGDKLVECSFDMQQKLENDTNYCDDIGYKYELDQNNIQKAFDDFEADPTHGGDIYKFDYLSDNAAATTTANKSNASKYSLSCGTIDLTDNFVFTASTNPVGETTYYGYYQLTPHVNFTNRQVSSKIEKVLSDALTIYDEYSGGEVVSSLPDSELTDGYYCEFYTESKIKSVYEENGLIFIAVDIYYSGYRGARSDNINTYVFNTATGEQYTLSDFITDRENFEYEIYEYIYYNFSTEAADAIGCSEFDAWLKEATETSGCYEYQAWIDYKEILEANEWISGEWIYDGEKLTVAYHNLYGFGYMYGPTYFDIPAYVWDDYVDFSV
ncbi:MAG: hypothetical protein ACI4RG_07900 [Huintestinicola sp.]